MTDETTYWYRFEEVRYAAPLDEFGYPTGSGRTVLYLRKLKVVRETPKGVQLAGLNYSAEHPRFVRRDSRKRFACPTVDEAVQSYRARKEKQINIYKVRISSARHALRLISERKFEEGISW
jgi:hypothetical protein